MRRIFISVGMGVLLLGACKPAPTAGARLPVYTVQVATPRVQDVAQYREWIGGLQADVAAEVLPHVQGYVVERCFVNGGRVKQGQLLYRIDDTLYEEALQQAQHQAVAAEAAAKEAQQNVEYYRPLIKDGSVARQTFTEAERKAEAALANLQAAQAAVEQARSNVDYCSLRSPVDGIAGFAAADVGSYVSPGGKPLVTVARIDPIRVVFSISEQDWLNQGGVNGALRPGAGLEVILPNGEPYPHPAIVQGVDNIVSASMGTLQLDAMLPNPETLLRPGMFVTVRATVSELKNALLVPEEAVVSLQGKNFVVAVGADDKVELIPVTTGPARGGDVVIHGAVSQQMRIVVRGTQQALMALSGRAALKIAQ